MTRANEIPVAHTPPGGYGAAMPEPILRDCTEALAGGAPDLRGVWKVVSVEVDGQPAPADHPIRSHVERIEQCGNRVVVTAAGLIHDMRADGTPENGVNDVAAVGHQPIQVVATFESGVLVLRPVGTPGVEVTRHREGEDLVWRYHSLFTARLRRVEVPSR
jgi:hypothetical protein